jgi:hypothetical protein
MCRLSCGQPDLSKNSIAGQLLTIRLPDCRADDGQSIRRRKRAKSNEHDNPEVEGVDDVLAS